MDDARVGSHKAIDIGPYLEHVGIECCGYDAGSIVRAATSEVCRLAGVAVLADEAGNDHNGSFCCAVNATDMTECFAHQAIGQFCIERLLAVLAFGLDEVPGVHACAAIDERRNDM